MDNWHRLDENEKKAIKKWWQQQGKLHCKVKWLLSDRAQAKSDLEEFIYGDGDFDLDEIEQQEKQEDNLQLLAKVTERLEQWQTTVASLSSHNIARAKPFHILFVLYRWAGRKQQLDFQDFEGIFCQLIREDIDSLRGNQQLKGFADALIDYAFIYIRFKTRLTQATFLRLADFHRREEFLFPCYQATTLDDNVWGMLRYYLSVSGTARRLKQSGSEAVFLGFVKEDLAEAIIDTFGRSFELQKIPICHFIVNDANPFSASKMLYAAAVNGIFDTQTTISFIRKLLNEKNSDYAYPELLFNSILNLSDEERETLLEQFISINPIPSIILRYLGLLEKSKAQQKATDLLIKSQSHQVIFKCFDLLGKTEVTEKKANRLLVKKNQSFKIICKCFDLLGKTEITEKKANELLAQKDQTFKVICKCLDFLGKTEAIKQKASELLSNTQDRNVIFKCFDILGKTEVAWQKASELLINTQDSEVICKCFDILGKTDITQQKARELLTKAQYKEVICKCFDILGKTEETQQKASELLNKTQDKEVICKCFDVLGKTKETKQKAVELLEQGNQSFPVICKCFAILGKDEQAKKYARQFLLQSDNEPILAWCVNILEEEAKPFALKRLENWETLEPKLHLLKNCLYVSRNEKQIEGIVETIIMQKNDSKPSMQRYISTLKIPLSDIQIWQQETTIILADWKNYNRAFVGASLLGNRNDFPKVKQTCQDILLDWEREISYQQEKGYKIYHFHIFKALSYPSAEDPLYRCLVDMTAKAMLAKEKQHAGFLGNMLYEAAHNIVHHQQYPAWIPEEEI